MKLFLVAFCVLTLMSACDAQLLVYFMNALKELFQDTQKGVTLSPNSIIENKPALNGKLLMETKMKLENALKENASEEGDSDDGKGADNLEPKGPFDNSPINPRPLVGSGGAASDDNTGEPITSDLLENDVTKVYMTSNTESIEQPMTMEQKRVLLAKLTDDLEQPVPATGDVVVGASVPSIDTRLPNANGRSRPIFNNPNQASVMQKVMRPGILVEDMEKQGMLGNDGLEDLPFRIVTPDQQDSESMDHSMGNNLHKKKQVSSVSESVPGQDGTVDKSNMPVDFVIEPAEFGRLVLPPSDYEKGTDAPTGNLDKSGNLEARGGGRRGQSQNGTIMQTKNYEKMNNSDTNENSPTNDAVMVDNEKNVMLKNDDRMEVTKNMGDDNNKRADKNDPSTLDSQPSSASGPRNPPQEVPDYQSGEAHPEGDRQENDQTELNVVRLPGSLSLGTNMEVITQAPPDLRLITHAPVRLAVIPVIPQRRHHPLFPGQQFPQEARPAINPDGLNGGQRPVFDPRQRLLAPNGRFSPQQLNNPQFMAQQQQLQLQLQRQRQQQLRQRQLQQTQQQQQLQQQLQRQPQVGAPQQFQTNDVRSGSPNQQSTQVRFSQQANGNFQQSPQYLQQQQQQQRQQQLQQQQRQIQQHQLQRQQQLQFQRQQQQLLQEQSATGSAQQTQINPSNPQLPQNPRIQQTSVVTISSQQGDQLDSDVSQDTPTGEQGSDSQRVPSMREYLQTVPRIRANNK